MASGDGEGATEFHDYEGGGVGEGEGSKDVSDKIENEDQVKFSDTFCAKCAVFSGAFSLVSFCCSRL